MTLARVVGIPGAILLGLGSILGTGVFVSLGLAADVAGAGLLPAIAIAAVVALLNGMSSAQLAAAHPVSGGTYEYGHRWLTPALGFTAGWTFLLAKSASAASAALGLAAYLQGLWGSADPRWRVAFGVLAVLAVSALVAGGLRRSNRVNALLVTGALLGLAAFVVAGLPGLLEHGRARCLPAPGELRPIPLLHASALMFVAFTGYGRIATLGEEVREPARSIPRAVVLCLLAVAIVYLAVAAVALAAVGAPELARVTRAGAPLETIARAAGYPGVALVVALGAVLAMVGVLLNLSLGLSRVVLAMARRGDLPRALARVSDDGSPRRAVWAVAAFVLCLTSLGSVHATWSFSAFTVLVYYSLTNLAAARMESGERRWPRLLAVLGLAGCLGLAFFVDPRVWGLGLAFVTGGLLLRALLRRSA